MSITTNANRVHPTGELIPSRFVYRHSIEQCRRRHEIRRDDIYLFFRFRRKEFIEHPIR